ncbi:MAG: Sapep family Mn(2+)-dependent dipeptidase [Clostridiales bacterium]|nr:Sapep family Mn(2+)-dependent dipeptidase [Clostridiales bacterium]
MNRMTDSEKTRYNKILSDLVSIQSQKGIPQEGAPYGEAPKKALDYLLSLAREDGFISENIGNKAGYIQWGSRGPLVAALGHLDVVPEGSGWVTSPFELDMEGDYFTGRGVVDDKGPVISTYMALCRLKEKFPDPDFRLRLIVGTDEENGSSCMARYCETEELPDIGFTPDAEFPCIYAEKGIYQMHFEGKPQDKFTLHGGNAANMVPPYCECIDLIADKGISANGLQAHASHPDMGVNAIDLMLSKMPQEYVTSTDVLSLMKKYFSSDAKMPFKEFFPEDESGKMTTNVGIVSMNKEESRLHVDIRFPVTVKTEEVTGKLQEIAGEFGCKVVDDSVLPPLFKDKNSEQIRALTEIYSAYREEFAYTEDEKQDREQALKESSEAIAIGGGTYARTMPNIVAFGPQLPWNKDQCHQANEKILKENLYLLVAMYEEALEKLASVVSKD